MQTLDISYNSISNFTPITSLSHLQNLYIVDSQCSLTEGSNFESVINSAIMSNLVTLNISCNDLSKINSTLNFNKYKNLTLLDLSNDNIASIPILNSVITLNNLNLSNINQDFSPLLPLLKNSAPNLLNLNLSHTNTTSVDISNFQNLQKIDLSYTAIQDFSNQGCSSLTSLNLSNSSNSNFTVNLSDLFENSPNLQDLNILNDTNISAKTIGTTATKLTTLAITQNSLSANNSGLLKGGYEYLPNIINYSTVGIKNLTINCDITNTFNFSWFKSLKCQKEKCQSIQSMTIISAFSLQNLNDPYFSNLTSLSLTNLENNVGFSLAPKLKYLNITNGNYQSIFNNAQYNLNLTSLTLNDITNFPAINNLSSLTNLNNLTSLNLTNDGISNISDLENLTNLTSLNLSNNKISNISPLKGLVNLVDTNNNGEIIPGLNLTNNNISNWESLNYLQNNPEGNNSWYNYYVRSSQL